jgi:hypothetical protein
MGRRITQGDCNRYEARPNYQGVRGEPDCKPFGATGYPGRLSQHPWKVFMEGKHDPHRLSVHGLIYLQYLDRERARTTLP